MTAKQAAGGAGYQRGHRKRHHDGCPFSKTGHDGRKCTGVIGRTVNGIAETFGIPHKGVIIAFILVLVFSFPVGVMLFALSWAYVHHPEWFESLRGKMRGSTRPAATNGGAGAHAAKREAAEGDRPTMGVDFEEPWMEELRAKFDDLERRTGDMEGYVASGDYRLASELEKMKKDDDAAKGNAGDASDGGDGDQSSPNGKA